MRSQNYHTLATFYLFAFFQLLARFVCVSVCVCVCVCAIVAFALANINKVFNVYRAKRQQHEKLRIRLVNPKQRKSESKLR